MKWKMTTLVSEWHGAHLLISMCKHTERCNFAPSSHFFRYKDISRALNRSSPDQTSSCPYKYIIVQTNQSKSDLTTYISDFCISEVQGNSKFLINERVNIRGEKVNTVLVSMRHTFASFKMIFLVRSVLMTLEISSACKSSSQLLF